MYTIKKLPMNEINYFSRIPIGIVIQILMYILSEKLGELSRCNNFFNNIIKEKIFTYKKIIHFGDLGAIFDDNKNFADWYCESYIKSAHSPAFKTLSLSQRKLFSEIKEGKITDASIKYMGLEE